MLVITATASEDGATSQTVVDPVQT
jgi:hypothetical protein